LIEEEEGMNRVKHFHAYDVSHKEERDWRVSGEIDVQGLGLVKIDNCLSQETIDKVCGEILFALSQKMGVKHEQVCPAAEAQSCTAAETGR
jgi:hypothetical protein